jgi:hypothetical protein
MAVGRPRQYPILSCPCCQADMVRHHDIYYDCSDCQAGFKMVDSELVRQQKRKKAEPVKRDIVKYLDADGYDELCG